MRIPSTALPEHLEPGVYVLRNATFALLNSQVPFAEAVSMAYRGEVEGIATKAGRVKYLRQLPMEERVILPPVEPEQIDDGKCSAFAQTNMGVFREAVREVTVQEYLGFRYAVESGDFVGHVYTHCALR